MKPDDAVYRIILMIVCVVTLVYAKSAAYNALDAHRHTHELGCAVGVEDLCKWVNQ